MLTYKLAETYKVTEKIKTYKLTNLIKKYLINVKWWSDDAAVVWQW